METKIIYKEESYQIMGACFEVYKEQGCGFLEACVSGMPGSWSLVCRESYSNPKSAGFGLQGTSAKAEIRT